MRHSEPALRSRRFSALVSMIKFVAFVAFAALVISVPAQGALAAPASAVPQIYTYDHAPAGGLFTTTPSERGSPLVRVVAGHWRSGATIAVGPKRAAGATTTYDGLNVLSDLTMRARGAARTERPGAVGTSLEQTGVAANTGARAADDLIEVVATACARSNSFDAGTLVLMADGSHKRIEDVQLGDEVIASDPETGEQGPRKVIDLIRHSGLHTMVDVEFSDGSQIDATDEHPFWVASRGEWVDAIDLHAGDVVISADGATVSVTSTVVSRADLTAYNLTIAGLHTYHVGIDDVLVHNAGCDEWAAAFVKRTGGTSDEIKTFESPVGRQNGFLGPYRPGGPGTKAVDEDWVITRW